MISWSGFKVKVSGDDVGCCSRNDVGGNINCSLGWFEGICENVEDDIAAEEVEEAEEAEDAGEAEKASSVIEIAISFLVNLGRSFGSCL